MLRVALHGNIAKAAKLTEIIRKKNNFQVSGICVHQEIENYSDLTCIDHPVKVINNFYEILSESDIIIFLEHNKNISEFIKESLRNSKHVFVNPSETIEPELLNYYLKIADEAGVILYLYHKPDMGILGEMLRKESAAPEFIDNYRYIHQKKDSSEEIISALFYEMLYLHSIIQFPIKRFKVATVPYYSDKPFIVNLRVEFTNGTTANITLNTFTGLESRFSELYFTNSMIQVNTLEERIQQRFWKTDHLTKHRLEKDLLMEKDPTSDIFEFLDMISSLPHPVHNYLYGHHIYGKFWEILKEISPVGALANMA